MRESEKGEMMDTMNQEHDKKKVKKMNDFDQEKIEMDAETLRMKLLPKGRLIG